MKDLIDRNRCKFIDQLQCDASFSMLLLVYGFNSVSSVYVSVLGHLKNIHLHSCKHKTVKLKLTLTLTLTLTDTGGTVLTLMENTKTEIAEI